MHAEVSVWSETPQQIKLDKEEKVARETGPSGMGHWSKNFRSLAGRHRKLRAPGPASTSCAPHPVDVMLNGVGHGEVDYLEGQS